MGDGARTLSVPWQPWSDVDLIAESKDIDAILQQRPAGILIATPSATHADVAIPFIEAGIPAFIESRWPPRWPMRCAFSRSHYVPARRSSWGTCIDSTRHCVPQRSFCLNWAPYCRVLGGMNQHPRTDSSVLWDWPHGLSVAQDLLDANPRSVQTWCGGEVSHCKTATAKFEINDVPFIASVSWLSLHKRHGMTILGSDNSPSLTTPHRKSLHYALATALRTRHTVRNCR